MYNTLPYWAPASNMATLSLLSPAPLTYPVSSDPFIPLTASCLQKFTIDVSCQEEENTSFASDKICIPSLS